MKSEEDLARERHYKVILDNVNVSKTSDGKEFLILIAGLICLLIAIITIGDLFANIFISNMSDKTQMKIEKMFGELPKDDMLDKKYAKQFNTLKMGRKMFIHNDKELQNKSTFPIIITDKEIVNAWIVPNGTIRFTTGLLKENLSDEELLFVLAHEMGHYKHRDHLRSLSRKTIIALGLALVLNEQSQDFQKAATSITKLENLGHTRRQERNADLYASETMMKLYGSNDGGIKFLEYLDKKDSYPEFFAYLSDHPSNKNRIKFLKQHRIKYEQEHGKK